MKSVQNIFGNENLFTSGSEYIKNYCYKFQLTIPKIISQSIQIVSFKLQIFSEASNLYHKKIKKNEMSFLILEISLEGDFKNLETIYYQIIINFSLMGGR